MFLRIILVCVMCAVSALAMADIYSYRDKNGNLVVTDTIPKDSKIKDVKKIETKPLMTIPALKSQTAVQAIQSAKPAEKPLTITLKSPQANETISRNSGEISFAYELSSTLPSGWYVQAFVDAVQAKGLLDERWNAESLDPGEHKYTVKVFGDDGAVKAEQSVTFFIRQQKVKK
jgi:hypothetical protein